MPSFPIVRSSEDFDAALVLSNGLYFFGKGIGEKRNISGEVCFNTSITGYQEILTDPSYTGQIINFTMPHIGNVGCNNEDNESPKTANGLILSEDITLDSNFRSEINFNNWLISNKLSGICGIDTRNITKLIRENGYLNAIIYYADQNEEFDIANLIQQAKQVPTLKDCDLASKISTNEPYIYNDYSYKFGRKHGKQINDTNIIVLDFGIKDNILNSLLAKNFKLHVLPSDSSFDEIIKLDPDGIFLSNGPGDPFATSQITNPVIQEIISHKIPLFGICLGHQLLALASGLATEKMHQGHRGANHPVIHLENKKVEITSQNHGFCVTDKNLPKNVTITHRSLFDGTIEGIKINDNNAFSVQYHPESSPGPHDSQYLFDEFAELVKKYKNLKKSKNA